MRARQRNAVFPSELEDEGNDHPDGFSTLSYHDYRRFLICIIGSLDNVSIKRD